MSVETEFSEQFYENSKTFFSKRVDYTSVTALLLYWKENDIGPEQELDAIRELFEQDFGFASLTFPIPSHRAQQELNREISAFVANYSNQVDSLIVVYYAGHGEVDADGKSVWAAAALVVKGDKGSGKFEILGASAKGIRTPEPGKSSFTSILIKHVRRSLKKNQQINARNLHGELLEDTKLTETPQYADLARNNPRSIVLQPLKPLQCEGFVKKPASFLMLKVSLADDPTGLRIAEWLKAHPPEGVTAVTVEALVLKARRLQGVMNQSAFPPGSILGKISESAQTEILHQLQGLNTVLYTAERFAQVDASGAKEPAIFDTIQALDQSVGAVCKAIETPLLLDPEPVEQAEMRKESGHPAVIAATENAMSLRRRILSTSAASNTLALPRDALNLPPNRKDADGLTMFTRFQNGTLGFGTSSKDILVESFEAEVLDEFPHVEKTAQILCHTKSASFHILPCIGYIYEPLNHAFGFVFDRPPGTDKSAGPMALSELYGRAPMVALGIRIRLAHELIVALENFHRVGWVHKGISSHNTVFLPRDSSAGDGPHCVRLDDNPDCDGEVITVDLASPWIFGFDSARADEDGSNMGEDHSLGNNIYRHPARWGRPSMRFTKAHDVYSLGIILLEIAFWRNVLPIAGISNPLVSFKTHRLVPEKIPQLLAAKCTRKLPHHVGRVFTETIVECLDFERKTKDMTAYDQHRYYEKHITEGMAKAVGRV